MFLQLIAAKLISIERRHGRLSWILSKEKSDMAFPPYSYGNDACWIGINLMANEKKRQYALNSITIDK